MGWACPCQPFILWHMHFFSKYHDTENVQFWDSQQNQSNCHTMSTILRNWCQNRLIWKRSQFIVKSITPAEGDFIFFIKQCCVLVSIQIFESTDFQRIPALWTPLLHGLSDISAAGCHGTTSQFYWPLWWVSCQWSVTITLCQLHLLPTCLCSRCLHWWYTTLQRTERAFVLCVCVCIAVCSSMQSIVAVLFAVLGSGGICSHCLHWWYTTLQRTKRAFVLCVCVCIAVCSSMQSIVAVLFAVLGSGGICGGQRVVGMYDVLLTVLELEWYPVPSTLALTTCVWVRDVMSLTGSRWIVWLRECSSGASCDSHDCTALWPWPWPWPCVYLHCVPKKRSHFYFFNNSVKC